MENHTLLVAFTMQTGSPGWVAQLVRASFPYTKVVGLIPSQGTYEKQSMRECINK